MFLSQNHNPLTIAYALAIAWSIVALLVFLFSLPSLGNDEEGNDRRRDRPEDVAMQKLVLCPTLTIISSVGLAYMVWFYLLRKTVSYIGGYQIGLLGGSTLLYAGMAFISFLYFINFEPQEDENRDGRYLEEQQENEERNEEEEIEFRQGILRNLCLVTSIIYTLLSFVIVWKYRSYVTKGASPTDLEEDVETSTRKRAYADVFSDAWNAISASSILLLFVSLIVVMSSLFGEEGERAREQKNIYNLILIVGFILVLSFLFLIAGRVLVFGRREKNNFNTGVFHGGILFFGVSLFMVAILYGNFFQFEERRREEMRGSVGISLVCTFLAILHFMFAFGMIKYQPHVLAEEENSKNQEGSNSYMEMT